MSLIVQKFGGTSVASVAHIEKVAARILKTRSEGYAVVVVVSAMGNETDRLDALAREVDYYSPEAKREMDVLLSTGEQITTSLLSMVLMKRGCRAKSYTGGQIRILTDSAYTRARIRDIDTVKLRADIDAGLVPVITGFQGVDSEGDITTFGRGGSDTTAVALAAVLKAEECQIFTDVDGVYTTDPKVVEGARCLRRITFEEMLELASLGTGVLHARAVEFASKYKVPLRVLSSFDESPGTLITNEDPDMEQPTIAGIAATRDEAKLTVLGVKDIPGIASRILGPISDAGIEVDMIVQNVAADMSTDFTFTVRRDDYDEATKILKKVANDIDAREVSGDNKIAKLSMVGVGMRSHAGVASKMFRILADESINILMISTSEIKISVVISEKYLELATRALHSAFDLAKENGELT
ncbi:MAG: aspartate kinase [Proteobacteria bacterium]|nr:aspartate kinase [Pseudomonadota bacterium]